MNPETAKKIGSALAVKSVSIGLVIAYIIMVPVSLMGNNKSLWQAMLWIIDWIQSEFLFHIIIGIIAFYACGYFFGGRAGKSILIKHRNYLLVGVMCGLLTLLTTVFLGTLTGFFMGLIHGRHYIDTADDLKQSDFIYENFINYIFKPMFWFSIFGFLPAIGVGVWFGWRLKRKGASTEAEV